MPRNVEIKARIASIEALQQRAAAVATAGPFRIQQDDTFFHCATGRLKLRDFLDGSGELIFYQRADESGPKESFYVRSLTSTPAELREALRLACGETGRVVKQRRLYLAGRTRIHLDRVEALGDFVELEVVLEEGETAAAGRVEAEALMQALGIAPEACLQGAYVDLGQG